jgi:hypothetical protein
VKISGTFFIIFFWAFCVFAESVPAVLPGAISQSSDRQVLASYLREFPVEIADFDQTTESQETLNEFKTDWENYLSTGKLNEKWLRGFSFSKYLNEFFSKAQSGEKQALNITAETMSPLNFEKVAPDKDHSIHDPYFYIEQRIGKQTIEAIKNNDLQVILFGGDESSFEKEAAFDMKAATKLPSPYEGWGIKKYFIPSDQTADGKSKYLLLMPPSKEYLTHYAQMFNYAGIENTVPHLSETAIKKEKLELSRVFSALKQQLKKQGKVEISGTFLGYFNELTNSPSLKKISERSLGMGLTVAEMQDTQSSKLYLSLKSDLTIWGESSSRIVEVLLDVLHPGQIIFMGSAGSPANATKVYDLSVPQEFYLEDKIIPVRNIVYDELTKKGNLGPGIFLGGRHGHTNSPIEQTVDYVNGKIKDQVTSFDVEQNLIAKAVSAFNLKTNSQVKFGAVNVITDKPKNSFFSSSPMEDLTRINREKKAGSRKLAVSVALDAVRSAEPVRSGQNVPKFDMPVKINSTPQLKRVRQCVQLLGLAS